ncbi:MAG: HDOD domain-containing protein [Phycisphaerales bacterium]|jgi:HD-like signal output (HDOD) protein|nr:HDOD domain-containing protein [Phycisphaerales bacterium]
MPTPTPAQNTFNPASPQAAAAAAAKAAATTNTGTPGANQPAQAAPSSTASKDQAVANALREISHIATLPEITLKIVSIVEDPSSTAQDLHNVISKDPALCTRILKVVNSAFYGLPGQIGSINRAIVLLGLNAVKNIAIAASLAKLFKGGQLTPNFSAKDLWTHSIAVGTGTKLLAEQMKIGLGDEAFLAGLIHDIGIMVELQWDRNKLVEVLEKLDKAGPTADMMAIETQVFGATHQDFGSALSEKWKFPKSFTTVIGFHHRPMDVPYDQRTMAAMVFVADRLAAQIGAGFKGDTLSNPDIPADVLDMLKLTQDDLTAVKAKLPDAIKVAETVLG